MKKNITGIILLVFILTGCNSDASILKEYHKESQTINMSSTDINTINTDLYLSNDLCIIPVDYKQNKDESLKALSSLLINESENTYLYADNVYDKLYPASITKILTAFVALKYGNMSDEVTVSYNASHITESGAKLCGFNEGDKIGFENLLNALLIYSGNDAAIAVAEHISGSVEEFSKLMNSEAKKLGAVDTHFVNPHGLHDDEQYTTAYDLYLIFKEVIKYTDFVEIIGKSNCEVTYKDSMGTDITKTFKSTNLFLTDSSSIPDGITVIGGKTGTTNKAGSCLILLSKNKNNKDFISVILKAENRAGLFSQMSHLLENINN